MSDQISLLRAAAHPGNTDGVTATIPTMRYRPERCEFPIHVGVFFDGTRNNQKQQLDGASAAFVLVHGIEPFDVQRHVAAAAVETNGAALKQARFSAKVESLRAPGHWRDLLAWRVA